MNKNFLFQARSQLSSVEGMSSTGTTKTASHPTAGDTEEGSTKLSNVGQLCENLSDLAEIYLY